MKKFQKMLSILLTAAMLLGLLSGFSVAFAATTSDSGSCGTSVSYMYNSGTLFIYGSGRMSDYSLGGAPWNNYAAEISKVEISSGVQNIGAAAFANLTSCRTYVIPSTVTEVGQYAFVFNSALTTISLPGVLTVGSNAFVACDALSSASYPATAIIASGNDALTKAAGVGGGSSSGNTPSIPSDSQLFASGVDRGIKWKVYTEGTMVIEPEYSSQMAYMPTYTSQSSSLPWAAYATYVKTIIIADGILSVGDYAFANMSTATSVYIGQGVTTIGTCAFIGCSALQKIQFSAFMKTVSSYAFYGCNALTQVVTSLTAAQMTIAEGNDTLKNAMNGSSNPGSGTTPPVASTSGQIAGTGISWSVSAGLLSVTSSYGNEAIPNFASSPAPWATYATQITAIKLSGITQIGYYAFAGMTRLTSVDFGTAATVIQTYAFQGATSLQSLTLPGTLRVIESGAFADGATVAATTPNPEVLMDISFAGHNLTMRYNYSAGTPSNPSNPSNPGTIPGIGDLQPSSPTGSCGVGVYYAYDETTKKMVISGNGAINAYGDAWLFPWFSFAGYIREIEIKEGITSIPSRAFYTTGEMTTITIPKTVTMIGSYAFYLSNKLTTATIDNVNGAVNIDGAGNYNLISIATYTQTSPSTPDVPSTPEGVKYNGFIDGTGITWSFNISTGELLIRSTQIGGERIPDYSDYNRNLGTSYTTNIAPWAHLRSLVSKVTLQGILHVGQYAFSDMPVLTTVSFAGTTQSIGSFAFARDTAITHMTFPPMLVMVQHSAFSECNPTTVATTPLKKDVTITVGANNSITIQYEVAGSSNVQEGYIAGTHILWSFDKSTGLLTVESTSGVEDIPDMASGNSPWQEIAAQVVSLKMRGIRMIGDYAFSRMTSLITVDFAAETTTIGTGAFMKATSLRSLTFGPQLTVIEPYAFEDCTISATSPNVQGSINTNYGNTGLTITYGQNSGVGNGTNIPGTSIYWTYQNGTLTLQSISTTGDAIPDYTSSTATPWSSHRYNVTKIVMNGITRIGQYAFADLPYVREVVYASTTSEVAAYAFANCNSLKSQSLPAALKTIGYYAYYNCTDLLTYTPNTQAQMIIASYGNEGLKWSWSQGTNPGTPGVSQTTSGYISGTSISWSLNTVTDVLTLTSVASGGEAIPDTFESYPWSAETVRNTVKSIVLKGITDIGFGAFIGLTNLTQVTFDNMTRSINQAAFAKATSLRSLTLPASLTSIHVQAFTQCSNIIIYTPNSQAQMSGAMGVQNVTFQYGQVDPNPGENPGGQDPDPGQNPGGQDPNPNPGQNPGETPTQPDYSALRQIPGTDLEWRVKDGVLNILGDGQIPDYAAAADAPWAAIASEITKISIFGKVTSIGKYAFANMTALTDVSIPDTVTDIKEAAFKGCSALTEFSFPTALTTIGDSAFSGCTKLGNLELPAALTSIGREAFYDCAAINEINFASTSKLTIGASAFAGCTSLTKAVRPSETELAVSAEGNDALEKALRPVSASGTTSEGISWNADCVNGMLTLNGTGAMTDVEDFKQYMPYIKAVVIGTGITEIGEALFKNAVTVEKVILPTTLTKIGAEAFAGCTALTEVKLPASVTEIGERAFKGCTALTEMALPQAVTVLPAEIFAGCTSLKTVTTSYLLTTIGQGAFKGCTALEKFTIPATVTTLASEAFNGCSALTTLIVAKGGLTAIPANTFSGCDALTAVYFAGSEAEWTKLTANSDAALKNATYNKAITLTIEYYDKYTKVVAPSVVIVGAPGDVAQVVSPVLPNYSTRDDVVSRTLSADETFAVVYDPDRYSVVIHYVDDKGNEIAPSTLQFLYYNEEFKRADESVLPVINGYRADREAIDLGVVTGPVEAITVIYTPREYKVNVVQVDKDGKQLSDKVYTFTGLFGTDVTIDLAQLDEIAHYELSDENVYVIKNISADITAEEPYKIVYQKKAYTLTVEFKDVDGFMVDPSKTITVFYGEPVNYEVPSLEDKGYIPVDSVLTLEAYNGEETLVARYKLKTFSVELQFVEVNSDGHKMLDSETVDIVYGTNFIYEIPAINGYVASQTKVDLGIVTTQPEGPIIIEYTPALYNLTIQLFDKDGKSLGSQIVKDIQVGSTYKIALDPVEGYLTDGIVIEDTMGPNDTNKIVSIVLEKKPEETQDDPGKTDPLPGNPEPDPADNTFETVIVIVLVVMVLALGAMIFYVSYLKKNN